MCVCLYILYICIYGRDKKKLSSIFPKKYEVDACGIGIKDLPVINVCLTTITPIPDQRCRIFTSQWNSYKFKN